MLAVGAAGAVSATSLAGALGLLPAAVAQVPQAGSQQGPQAASQQATPAAGSAAANKSTTAAKAAPRSGPQRLTGEGSWLTVKTGPPANQPDQPAHQTAHQPARQPVRQPAKPPAAKRAGRTPASTTPGPALPDRSGSGRRVVYSVSDQRVWLVGASGNVVRTYLVSGPRGSAMIAPGRYSVTSKAAHESSRRYQDTMNDVVRFSKSDKTGQVGNGSNGAAMFEDIPATGDGALVQSQSQLGTPVSDEGIRQWFTDAQALWQFAHVGTPVVVLR